MSKQRNDGQSSRPLNKSVIWEALYQTQMFDMRQVDLLRESYIQWDPIPDGTGDYKEHNYRYFKYRDGSAILHIGDPSHVPFDWYLWKDNPPSAPGLAPKPNPSSKPIPAPGSPWALTSIPDPAGGGDNFLQGASIGAPHGLKVGDTVMFTGYDKPVGAPGRKPLAITGKVTTVVDPNTVLTDIRNPIISTGNPGQLPPPNTPMDPANAYLIYPHSGYVTFIYNGTLYIKYWDPTVLNPDGSYGNWKTVLPKAAILDQKVEYIYDTETEFPDPTQPPPAGEVPIYKKHVPSQVMDAAGAPILNTLGEALYQTILTTPLSVHSAVRYNAHIMRVAVNPSGTNDIRDAGVFGEYVYENNQPTAGQSILTIARKPQVGDFLVVMF